MIKQIIDQVDKDKNKKTGKVQNKKELPKYLKTFYSVLLIILGIALATSSFSTIFQLADEDLAEGSGKVRFAKLFILILLRTENSLWGKIIALFLIVLGFYVAYKNFIRCQEKKQTTI